MTLIVHHIRSLLTSYNNRTEILGIANDIGSDSIITPVNEVDVVFVAVAIELVSRADKLFTGAQGR